MSCYLIKVENGHKVARSITSEEEYKQLRGSNEQKANLRLARAGNDAAKRRLVQFNYSGHYPQGVVKGMKLPSGAFGFDMDEPEAFAKAAKLLLKEPDKYGLLMLERSARQGGHAVFERERARLSWRIRLGLLRCSSVKWILRLTTLTGFTSLPHRMTKICSSFRHGSLRMNMMRLPWQLKGKSWKKENGMGRRNCRKGRTRQTSIMSLGRKNSRRIRKGFLRVRNLRIREFLLLLLHPLQLPLSLRTIILGFLMGKSLRSGGRCIMMGRSRCAPTAIR